MKLLFVLTFILMQPLLLKAQGDGDHSNHNSGPAPLNEGKYYGESHFNGRPEAIALQADIFQVAPSQFTEFPNLEILLKFSLGGYNSHEYRVFHFKKLNYNFETGDLNLDESSQDLIVDAKVHTMSGRTHIEGEIFSRTSNLSGSFSLLLESDEPPDDDDPLLTSLLQKNWDPLLEGEYEGRCDNNESTILQIQTAKDLHKDEHSNPSVFGYGIYAQLATQEKDTASSEMIWSVKGSFAGGLYDLFSGNLNFIGPATTTLDCTRHGNSIQCRYEIQEKSISCTLAKIGSQIESVIKYNRTFRLSPNTDQVAEIPRNGQLSDSELALLLKGNYLGYLHHENSNQYQKVFLDIKTRITTENPHNPNKVFISATATAQLNSGKNFLSYRFESKSFYLSSGFSLNAEASDAFIIISQWKKGYIQGVWYSKTFGRVGVVDFIKSDSVPDLPLMAKGYSDWIGEYISEAPVFNGISSWFKILFMNNPSIADSSLIEFSGSYRKLLGMDIISPIELGVVDPYAHRMNWIFKAHEGFALVTGDIVADGRLSLFWPASPSVFGAKLQRFENKNYIKKLQ